MTAPHGFCFAFLTAAILALSSGTAQAQTARTGGVMREKLGHAQRLLEALTTSNRELLVHESTEMVRMRDMGLQERQSVRERQGYFRPQ